jgi:hypothetical protein
VNPNPGGCWDGKFNLMAGFEGMRYSDLLGGILNAAAERLALHSQSGAALGNGRHAAAEQPAAGMGASN